MTKGLLSHGKIAIQMGNMHPSHNRTFPHSGNPLLLLCECVSDVVWGEGTGREREGDLCITKFSYTLFTIDLHSFEFKRFPRPVSISMVSKLLID